MPDRAVPEPIADGLELFGQHSTEIYRYIDILATRGVDHGLIGPREAGRIWDRHILNSVAIRGLLPAGCSIADIGSGAGLPGIPLALARPDLHVTLVEPLLRRVTFLHELVEELGLADRVAVVRSRADEVAGTFDVVTARAVAPLPRLLTWCAELVRPGGALVAIKGRSAAAEISEAAPHLRRRRLTAELITVRATPAAEPTFAVRVAFPA